MSAGWKTLDTQNNSLTIDHWTDNREAETGHILGWLRDQKKVSPFIYMTACHVFNLKIYLTYIYMSLSAQ